MPTEATLSTGQNDSRGDHRCQRITVIRPIWRRKALLICSALALLLVATWLIPATRRLWDGFDLAVFRLLNDSLALGHGWGMFWAVANHRSLDLLPALLILALFVASIWGRPREVQNQRWALLGVLSAVLIFVPPLMNLVVHQTLHYSRPSPTLVLDDTLRLSQLFPSIEAKDASGACFPGDHAFVLLTVTSFFWHVGRRRDALLATLVAAVFALPRLVGGGHWATDVIVGGGTAALLAGSWAFATPLCHRVATLLHPLVSAVMRLVPRPLRIPEWPEMPSPPGFQAALGNPLPPSSAWPVVEAVLQEDALPSRASERESPPRRKAG